ncbi:hypothetical protein [Microbacterium sp. USHLN186]|uniref:hypothetical protein n=1 Tax=Microbacterium sp. USHLN186 TaxID=3081286 RepID=UPI0030186823
MKFPVYLGMLQRAEAVLSSSFRTVADAHGDEPDIYMLCHTLADQCDEHERLLKPIVDRYGEQPDDEPERLHAAEMSESREGPLGMLRDLQDLHLLATMVEMTYTLVRQAALALRDEELLRIIGTCSEQTSVQVAWLSTRAKQAAPQALIAAR